MSTSTKTEKKPLPLPQAPQIVTEDSELLRTWESIDLWYRRVHTSDKRAHKKALRAYGCHIQLACQVLDERLRNKAKKQKEERNALLGLTLTTIRRVQQAFKWVGEQGVVKEDFRWDATTVIEVAQEKALAFFKMVVPVLIRAPANPRKLPVSLETIQDCERVWHNIVLYTEPKPGIKGLDRKGSHRRWNDVKSMLSKQLDLAARVKTESAAKQDQSSSYQMDTSFTDLALDVVDSGESSDNDRPKKRPRIGRSGPPSEEINHPRSPSPVFDLAAMLDRLSFDSAESPWLTLHDKGPITAETPGILKLMVL